MEDKTTWSVTELEGRIGLRNTGMDDEKENMLKECFPPLERPSLDVDPMCVTDKDGKLLCFYLPDILTKNRSVSQSVHLGR